MTDRDLWNELHHLFDTDDGSLPEIRIVDLTGESVAAIFEKLMELCQSLDNENTFWSIEDEEVKRVISVPNAAQLVVEGRAGEFHFLCKGIGVDGVTLPDLGVFIIEDEVTFDYRMGGDWNAQQLGALFRFFSMITRLAPESRLTLEPHVHESIDKQFQAVWAKYVAMFVDE